MNKRVSFIIPVYNRPKELQELLISFTEQKGYNLAYEIIVIEDGSYLCSEDIVAFFDDTLFMSFKYYKKANQGPGKARNYGFEKASGDFFMVLDSDVVLPSDYLTKLERVINPSGEMLPPSAVSGPDMAHYSFSPIQKAVSFVLTSFITTGGIRGQSTKNQSSRKLLRSYNMGFSRDVWEKTGGFSAQRIGEDIELSLRIKKLGYKTTWSNLLNVYHKRRTNFSRFFNQVFNFGAARPILSKMYGDSDKISYYFPSCFVIGSILSFIAAFLSLWFLLPLAVYTLAVFAKAFWVYKSIYMASLCVAAAYVQFFGYGLGFLRTKIRLLMGKSFKEAFPYMFS